MHSGSLIRYNTIQYNTIQYNKYNTIHTYIHTYVGISRWPKDGTFGLFYLTTHSTHFTYGYMASDIWLRTILIVRKETRCRHIGYSYRVTARVLLYAPSHRQDNTYHGLCYTSRGALAGTRNSSMGPPQEGSIRRPIAPWANVLPLSYVPLPPKDGTYASQCIKTDYLCLLPFAIGLETNTADLQVYQRKVVITLNKYFLKNEAFLETLTRPYNS